MKKAIIVIIGIICTLPNVVYALDVELKSNNVILYNLDNDEILYEKNSEELTKIASLTKIMTALVAIENIENIDEEVILTYDMFYNLDGASKAGFSIGDIVTYRDLLYGVLIPSGADATNALSILIAESEDNFVELMNNKALELGLVNTNFENASGLDTTNNYSTVYDVSVFLKYALLNDEFRKMYETKYYTTTNGLEFVSSLVLYKERYDIDVDFILGAKTGYTGLAGVCLASITSYNGINYLLVTTNAPYSYVTPNHAVDAMNIYDYYFNNYEYSNLLEENKLLMTLSYKGDEYYVYNDSDFYYYTLNGIGITYEYNGLVELNSDYKKGDKIGEYIVSYDNEIIKVVDVFMPINIILYDRIIICFLLGLLFGGCIVLGINKFKFIKQK